MLTETLELALYNWTSWTDTTEVARGLLGYDARCTIEQRLTWWKGNREDPYRKECAGALTHPSFPQTFTRYWIACFLLSNSREDFELICVPVGWLNSSSFLEVWPESHWPGFALRQADVLLAETA